MKPSIVRFAPLFALALCACASQAPPRLAPRDVSAPLNAQIVLPPGVGSPFKTGQALALRAPLALLAHPTPDGEVQDQLPAGSVVTLKARVLNQVGPWWLVDARNASGWVRESSLPRS